MAYRVGIIGCGRMGGTIDDEVTDWSRPDFVLPYGHVNGYAQVPETRVVAASDVDGEKLNRWCDRFGVPQRYTDYRDMIRKEGLDIVSVTTGSSSRAEPVLFASNHGVRGIYAEKPLCASVEELDAIVEACRRNGTHLAYGAMRRYWAGFETARGVIASGQLGSPRAVVNAGTNAQRTSCHVLHGGSHFVDALMYLLGDPEPAWVQAELNNHGGGDLKAVEGPDGGLRVERDPVIASATVGFENGARMAFTDLHDGEMEVTCERGILRGWGDSSGYWMRRLVAGPWSKDWAWEEVPFPAWKGRSGTVAIIRDLIRSIETGTPGRSNIEIARRGMEILFGMVASQRRGGVRVKLPLDDRKIWVHSA